MRPHALLWPSLVCFVTPLAVAAPVVTEHVTAELIALESSLQPGRKATLGVHLKHAPHWHTYWINPGDSGLPTRLEWQLPSGYRVSDVAWPAPQRFDLGGLFNFGYDGSIVLPVSVDVPANASSTARFAVEAKWLVCSEACIPGKATLSLELPLQSQNPTTNARHAPLFQAAQARQPQATDWRGTAVDTGKGVRIELHGKDIPNAQGVDVFPSESKLLGNGPPKFEWRGGVLVIDAAKSEYFETAPASLTLVFTQAVTASRGARAWRVTVPWTSRASTSSLPVTSSR